MQTIWKCLLLMLLTLGAQGTAWSEEAVTPPAPSTAGVGAVADDARGGRNPFQDGTPPSYDALVDQNRQLRLQVEIAERQARLAELRAKTAAADATARAALSPPKPVVVEAPKPTPEAPKPVAQAPVPVVTPAAPPPRPAARNRAARRGEGGTESGTRLVGFVGQAGELRALVQSGGRVVAVAPGDRVAGGTVQSIEPGRVTIGGGKGRARTLTTRIGPGEIADPQVELASTAGVRGGGAPAMSSAGAGGMPPALMGALGLPAAPVPSALPPVPSGR